MKYSVFSGIQGEVSKLGFGLMRLPKLYEGKEDIDYKEAERLVDLAYNNGVNYFDTAYVYHNGESEIFAGKILNKYPRESYKLATKLPGWAIKNDGKTVDELFNEQLKKCEVEYFDFYLLHSLNRDIWNTFKSVNAYENLKEKKAEGKIRHLGFSFHGDMELFKELLNNYEWDFVQLQINYYDWEADNAKDFYKLLEDKNIPCIVMEPVRGGSLQKLNDEAVEVFKKLSDNSPASYALRFVAELPNVLVTLSGMSTYEQVEDNINTFNECKPLSDEEKKDFKIMEDDDFKVEEVWCLGDCLVSKSLVFSLFGISLIFLFETKEDAEEYVEFGNIIKTEKLPYVSWEKFKNKEGNYSFKVYPYDYYCYTDGRYVRIKQYYGSLDRIVFTKPLTRENYNEARRLCIKLFTGEEV